MSDAEQELKRLRAQVADAHERMRAIILMPDWEQQAEARARDLAALDAYDKELEPQQPAQG